MKIPFLSLLFIFFQVTFGQNLVSYCPKCGQPADESRFHAYDDVFKRRWQTPAPGTSELYKDSYQDYHSLVGYADIRYTDSDRREADVCLVCIHRRSALVHFTYFFDDQPQAENCRRFSNLSQKSSVRLRVEASDGTKLSLSPVNFIWNIQPMLQRPGDYRDGQKGAIVELFGWKFQEIEQECELLGRAGYLGVKLCPVTEHIMSDRPENGALNPWYYVYQPISYQFDCRYGTREDLESLVNTCREYGVRVYVDMVLNHFSGPVGSSCNYAESGKKSSAPDSRQSPFFTHEHSGRVNPVTGELASYEYPGAAIGPEDFHCEKPLDKWDDLNVLNTGWLSGLADVNTTRENVRARQSAYIVELLSLGVSGFRLDAAKHMSPDDLAAIFKLVQTKMGGRLPSDFIAWLEVLTGSQAYVLWDGPSWYGHQLADLLMDALGSDSEVDKIKLFDSGYPVRPWENRAVASNRVVIQNDDHDSQSLVFYRDFGDRGCVLVKGCPPEQHRYYETRLFVDPYEVQDPANDWPIRILLSSFYHTHGVLAVPDGLSDCSRRLNKRMTSDECVESVGYFRAAAPGKCAYEGEDYTRVHRDIEIINAMRAWMRLEPARLTGADIGLPNCQ